MFDATVEGASGTTYSAENSTIDSLCREKISIGAACGQPSAHGSFMSGAASACFTWGQWGMSETVPLAWYKRRKLSPFSAATSSARDPDSTSMIQSQGWNPDGDGHIFVAATRGLPARSSRATIIVRDQPSYLKC